MSIDIFSMYGLLFERTAATRKAITHVRRRMGRHLRPRTSKDDNFLYVSVAMSYESLQCFTDIALAHGCQPGVHFAELMESTVIGTQPDWLCVESVLANADPWFGLRRETWDAMEPDVRELYEKLRLERKPVLSHIKERRALAAPDA